MKNERFMRQVDLESARRVSLREAREEVFHNATLVDLRTTTDYDSAVSPNTVRLTLREVVSHARAVDTPVIYYCDCGMQETSARAVLLVEKYVGRPVAAFTGSTDDWNLLQGEAPRSLAGVR